MKKMNLEISKKEGEQLGLPGKERMKPKLFAQVYNYKPDIPVFRDTDNFDQYLLTNDAFGHVEEYAHIERQRKVDNNEYLSSMIEEQENEESIEYSQKELRELQNPNNIKESIHEAETPKIIKRNSAELDSQ